MGMLDIVRLVNDNSLDYSDVLSSASVNKIGLFRNEMGASHGSSNSTSG